MKDYFETEVLIIGCGIAGSVTALRLADAGAQVTVATRAHDPKESNTLYAQGGIIYRGLDDSPEKLTEDILRAGAGHCNSSSVELLSETGPDLVQEILMERAGVRFERQNDGALSLAREAGHTMPRIVHAADCTGKEIEVALIKVLKSNPNITLLTEHTAVDLLTSSHHSLNRMSVYEPLSCVGAYLLDQRNDRVFRGLAKKTVLATGGLGQVYLRTTNPPGARGDGLAMAYRAGARIINNEFIQFHPTTFFHQDSSRFLISEAVRGAGARLVNADGEPFMQNYAPEWEDLAPRDVVARSIHQEMLAQDVPNVYLDLRSYIPADQITQKFPNIYESCLNFGVNITQDLAPVVPAAHYACGGVWVDEWGQTTIRDLYAVGEVACTGVHGANRLASTSLLEALVWGAQAAQRILQTTGEHAGPIPADIPPWQDLGEDTPDPVLITQDMSSIKHIMWNYVGLTRSTSRLQRALREMRNLETEIERFYRVIRLTDGLIGLRNAVRTAVIITSAAWENKKSMGCHYREDE